ncbi:MAG TPA: hypothetical protein DCM10_01055 [Xanthomarina gelatinilytica]|nr:hypothetical protein [Xanthomarina gelatinilytica]
MIKYNYGGIEGLTLIRPTVFSDHRGCNFELYDSLKFKDVISTDEYLQDNFKNKEFVLDTLSRSKKNVFRGLHGDNKTWKLVTCLQGDIILKVLHTESGKNVDLVLSSENKWQLLIPDNCANGHYCLSSECLFSYKMTNHYGGIDSQYTIKWNDENFNFNWSFDIKNAIMSERDH